MPIKRHLLTLVLAVAGISACVPGSIEAESAVAKASGLIEVTDHNSYPLLSRGANGNILVAWSASDVEGSSVSVSLDGRLYGPDGRPLGDAFSLVDRRSNYASGRYSEAAVGMDGMGNFVLLWSDLSGLSMQRFDSQGLRTGARVMLDYLGADPGISVGPDGSFIATWVHGISQIADPSAAITLVRGLEMVSVVAQRFHPDGSPLGERIVVDQTAPFEHLPVSSFLTGPEIARNRHGQFAVAWERGTGPDLPGATLASDGYSTEGFIRHYSSDAVALGAPTRVPSFSTWTYNGSPPRTALAIDDSGRSVVAWDGYLVISPIGSGSPHATDVGIYVRRFSPDGTADGPEQFLDSLGKDYTFRPAVAMNFDGSFAVVSIFGRKSSGGLVGAGLQLQRFSPDGLPFADAQSVLNTDQALDMHAVATDGIGNLVIAASTSASIVLELISQE